MFMVKTQGTRHVIIGDWLFTPRCRSNMLHILVLYETTCEESAASINLLSKCDFQLPRRPSNPNVLKFVYTIQSRRRKGYAALLVTKAQQDFQFTVFCQNDESPNFFAKLKCIKRDYLTRKSN